MNPLAIAVQGLGFGAALVAVQGLLAVIAEEVRAVESAAGGGLRVRRKARRVSLAWPADHPVDDDEAVLLAGLL